MFVCVVSVESLWGVCVFGEYVCSICVCVCGVSVGCVWGSTCVVCVCVSVGSLWSVCVEFVCV